MAKLNILKDSNGFASPIYFVVDPSAKPVTGSKIGIDDAALYWDPYVRT